MELRPELQAELEELKGQLSANIETICIEDKIIRFPDHQEFDIGETSFFVTYRAFTVPECTFEFHLINLETGEKIEVLGEGERITQLSIM